MGQINDPTAWLMAGAHKLMTQTGEQDSWGGQEQWSDLGYGQEAQWSSKGHGGSSGGDGGAWDSAAGEMKVKKTIRWYNTHGELSQQIIYQEVAPFLQAVGSSAALQILKGLDGKGPQVRDPTKWI